VRAAGVECLQLIREGESIAAKRFSLGVLEQLLSKTGQTLQTEVRIGGVLGVVGGVIDTERDDG